MAKILHAVLLLALVCGSISIIRADDETTTMSTTTTSSTTTTEKPETTTESTSTTTESTSTTTTTTTEKTTTTEQTTTTSTTTPVPPAPTTPVPDPQANHWVVKNDTKFCLMVDMAVQLNFTYITSEDGNQRSTALYDIPTTGKMVKGECTATKSQMMIQADNVTIELDFALNETAKQYNMMMVMQMYIAAGQYTNATEQNITVVLKYADAVPVGKSYHCNRQQTLNGTLFFNGDEGTTYVAPVTMSKAQWQAFHDRAADGYDLAKDCDAIDTPDIVPIAVGCALAGLVVIVLLGYLVGRRRAQGRGQYLAM